MTVKLITNTAYRDAAEFRLTDTAATPATISDDTIQSVTTGGRHLLWKQGSPQEVRFVFLETNGTLTYDTLVIARAENISSHALEIEEWTTWPTTKNARFSTSSLTTPNFVGPPVDGVATSTDVVIDAGAVRSNLEGIGVLLNDGTGGSYTRLVGKIYAGLSFTIPGIVSLSQRPLRRGTTVRKGFQRYQVTDRFQMQLENLTDDDATALHEQYHETTEPLFIWDDETAWVKDELWHIILGGVSVTKQFDNLHSATIEFFLLEYPGRN